MQQFSLAKTSLKRSSTKWRPFFLGLMSWNTMYCRGRQSEVNTMFSLHWRHNDHHNVSNHQPHGCFTQSFIREFPAQRASNAENVSIWWRHHVPSRSAPTNRSALNKSHISSHLQSVLYSVSRKTSNRQISWSLVAARLDMIRIVSLWNLADSSTPPLPSCLSNLRAITRFCGKTRRHEILR